MKPPPESPARRLPAAPLGPHQQLPDTAQLRDLLDEPLHLDHRLASLPLPAGRQMPADGLGETDLPAHR